MQYEYYYLNISNKKAIQYQKKTRKVGVRVRACFPVWVFHRTDDSNIPYV